MKNQNLFRFLILLNSMLLLAMLAGCGAPPATHSITVTTDTPVPVTETPTIEISPTAASTATATALSVAASIAAPLPECSIPYFEPVAFLPNRNQLLAKTGGKISILDTDTWAIDRTFEVSAPLDSVVALSPDGQLLAVAQSDQAIQLISVEDEKLINTLSGHTDIITTLKFSPESDRLLSASHDTWVRVWDAAGKLQSEFQPTGADNFPSEVLGLAISPDGTQLATIPLDGPVKLWDMSNFKEIAEVGGSGGYDTSDVDFSKDGKFLAADLATGLWIWDMTDHSMLMNGINSMAFDFSPALDVLAYADIGDSNRIVFYSLAEKGPIFRTEETTDLIWMLLYFPDGDKLISLGDQETRIWDATNGTVLYRGCNAVQ